MRMIAAAKSRSGASIIQLGSQFPLSAAGWLSATAGAA